MRDTKKILKMKIVRFKKIKLAVEYFFISILFVHLSIKTVFVKIRNSIFPPKYTRDGKVLRNKIL